MAYILNIETSTTNCSVSVSKDENILSVVEEDSKQYSHAEQLHIFIEKAIEEADISKQHLDAIAISKGPGSYTGLRIGVSSAKGIAYSLDIPLVSVSTLQSLAAKAGNYDTIIPMIDARRMEVYTRTFNADLEAQNKVEAKILDKTSFSELIKKKSRLCFIGNGAEKFQNTIGEHGNISFISTNPSAREMAILSSQKNKQHLYEDIAYFEPFYLKDFVGGR
jgi:tRNA threonylcarbamoyladenosine biosynthesis protein TsaB